MPRFAANLTILFTEVPFLDRFAEAARAGFDCVEVLFPYDEPAQEILGRLRIHDLSLALINCPPPNYTAPDAPRGFAAVPGMEDRFRHDFRRALRYASVLKPERMHIMSGPAEGATALATLTENLRWAATEAQAQGGPQLTIEPLNRTDNPGYFLADYDLAAEVLDKVAAPNLGLQYDSYHAQVITGDALAVWEKHRHRVTHVQVAQPPDRHEPDRGDPARGGIDFPAFFARLDAEGYTGVVSAEYHPKGRTEDGLGWFCAARG